MSWLGPADVWPNHPRGEADVALREARALGWFFKSESHFGRIRCPNSDHNDGGCTIQIYGTAGDKRGTATATIIRRALRKCSKLGPMELKNTAAGITKTISQLAALTEAALNLRASDEKRIEAEAILDMANDSPSEQDAAEAAAMEAEWQSDNLHATAWAKAIDADAADPWPPGERANGLIAAVEQRYHELEDNLHVEDLDANTKAKLDWILAQIADWDI